MVIFVVSLIVPYFLRAMPENRPGLSLKETFDIYVRAVQNSDLKTLFSTVTKNGKFLVIQDREKLNKLREESLLWYLEKYKLICFTPIGVPYEWPETPDKRKLEDVVIFETFSW